MAKGSVISAVLTLKDKDFTSNAKKATKSLTETERQTKHAKNQFKKYGKTAAAGLKKASKFAATSGAAIGAMGVAAFAATKRTAEGLDDIAKKSEKLGVSTDAFQEMSFWAEQNGIASQQLERGVGRLNQRIGRAAAGNKKYSSALENLGVDMNKVKNGSVTTEDAMATSIKTLSEMDNATDQSALASELFGTKLARDLMPALQDGSLSLEDAAKKAHELGGVIGEDSISAATKFSDTWSELKTSVVNFGIGAVAGLLPFFQGVMDFAMDKMPAVKSVISNAFDKIGTAIDWFKEKGTIALDAVKKAIDDNKPSLEGFKGMASDAGEMLKSAFEKAEPVVDWIAEEGIPKAVDVVSDLLEKAESVYNYIKDNWGLIGPIVGGITAGLVAYKLAVTGVKVATAIWNGVTNAAKLAQLGLSAVMNMSPLGWIVTIIGLAVTAGIALYKNWDTVTKYAGILWDKIKGVGSWIKEKFVAIFQSVVEKGKEIIDRFGGVKGMVLKLLGPFGKVVEAGIFVYKNWDTIKEKAGLMVGYVKDKIIHMKDQVIGKFTDMKDGAIEKFKDIVQWAKDLPGKIGKGIANYASKALDGIKDLATGLLDKFKETLGIKSPSSKFFAMAKWIVKGLVNGLGAENLKSLGKSVFGDFAGGAFDTIKSIGGFVSGMFGGGGKVSGGVSSWIKSAIAATGAPSSWQSALETIAMKESGGRTGPSTVNKWDSNWHRGTPSMGLMQTIRPTFDAYKMSGMNDIMNPIHNAVAAINYIKSRYGNPFNTPGISSMARGGPYKGYEQGGRITSSGRYLVGESGPELVNLKSGSKVSNKQDSKGMSKGDVNINIENIIAKGASVDEIVNDLVPKLRLRLANM